MMTQSMRGQLFQLEVHRQPGPQPLVYPGHRQLGAVSPSSFSMGVHCRL